jgi:hypothetical protein
MIAWRRTVRNCERLVPFGTEAERGGAGRTAYARRQESIWRREAENEEEEAAGISSLIGVDDLFSIFSRKKGYRGFHV